MYWCFQFDYYSYDFFYFFNYVFIYCWLFFFHLFTQGLVVYLIGCMHKVFYLHLLFFYVKNRIEKLNMFKFIWSCIGIFNFIIILMISFYIYVYCCFFLFFQYNSNKTNLFSWSGLKCVCDAVIFYWKNNTNSERSTVTNKSPITNTLYLLSF